MLAQKFMQQHTVSSDGLVGASPSPAALQATAGIASLPAGVEGSARERRPSAVASKAHALLNGLGRDSATNEANVNGSTRFAPDAADPPPPDKGENDSADDSDAEPTQADIRTAQVRATWRRSCDGRRRTLRPWPEGSPCVRAVRAVGHLDRRSRLGGGGRARGRDRQR